MKSNPPVASAKWWRHLGWRCDAETLGFSSGEAARLAFWRWLARRRSKTKTLRQPNAEGAAQPLVQ